LSILELNNGVFQVLSTNGNTRLGGDDLDKRLVDFLIEKIRAAGGPELSLPEKGIDVAEGEQSGGRTTEHALTMLARIREAAEQAKIKLSSELEVEITLPFLIPDFSFNYKLTRNELETLTADIIART